jgi:hypothetical protein
MSAFADNHPILRRALLMVFVTPIIAAMLLLEPVVAAISMFLFFGGLLVCGFFMLDSGQHHPLLPMALITLGAGLFALAYNCLLAYLVSIGEN